MAFTVREFDDLLKILEAQPEWRTRLRRALFPEIDVPKALQELAEAQKRTEAGLQRLEQLVAELVIGHNQLRRDVNTLQQDVGELKQDVGELKQDVGELKQDVGELKQDVGELKQDVSALRLDVGSLKQDVGKLKGKTQEDYYRSRASGIFGGFLRNGRETTNRVADQLYAALYNQQVTQEELNQVLAADLLWAGEDRQTQQRLILVMEASWLAEEVDVQRAADRAAVLQRLGLPALAVVGGDEWTENAVHLAHQLGVVRTRDGQVDLASWQTAWLRLQQRMGPQETNGQSSASPPAAGQSKNLDALA